MSNKSTKIPALCNKDILRSTVVYGSSYFIIGVLILTILVTGLFPALIAGMITYLVVHMLAPGINRADGVSGKYLKISIGQATSRAIAVAMISTTVIFSTSWGIWSLVSFLTSDQGNAQVLLEKLADILDNSRSNCPDWICSHIPVGAENLREQITGWMRTHAGDMKSITESTGHTFVRILIGMIIGAMVSLKIHNESTGDFANALLERIAVLADSFKKIVFAQIKISSINAIASGIFIFLILPMFDVNLPLGKTLVALTFILGLIPIVGNVLSNTMMVIIALPFGAMTAIGCLAFLVVLHKVEYFLNAKIVGNQIKSNAWELLIAMLLMEAIFGLIGLVAAPILYAYVKQEMINKKLV